MSGGHFDYNQYHIEQIADSIAELLLDITKPRPPKHVERWVSVRIKHSENSEGYYDSNLWNIMQGITDIDTAKAVLFDYYPHLVERDGHIYDPRRTYTDSDGLDHPYEYIIKECENLEYDKGYEDTHYYGPDFREDTIEEFLNGLQALRKAYIYAQRIDWLLSGDDGEDTFHERLKKKLDKLNKSANP